MTSEYESFVNFLRPKRSPFPLRRVGGSNDGSYLIPLDLEGIEDCFSPGVENRKNFEDALVEKFGIRTHLMDFSSDPNEFQTPLISGMQSFEKKWLSSRSDSDSMTLSTWVDSRAQGNDSDLLLQMDIEDAEWEVLANTPLEVLGRFRIAVIEFHGVQRAIDSKWLREVGLPVVNKLATIFSVVHIHPNNCCDPIEFFDPGIVMPKVLEVTLLRQDRMALGNHREARRPSLPRWNEALWNVKLRRPLHLDRSWTHGHRSTLSRVRMVLDWLLYFFVGGWKKELPDFVYRRLRSLMLIPKRRQM